MLRRDERFGGLLVGTVIKYADAVMKDVALGSSIVCRSLASTVLFDFELNAAFAAGIAAVIYSVFLYGQRARRGALTPPEGRWGPGMHRWASALRGHRASRWVLGRARLRLFAVRSVPVPTRRPQHDTLALLARRPRSASTTRTTQLRVARRGLSIRVVVVLLRDRAISVRCPFVRRACLLLTSDSPTPPPRLPRTLTVFSSGCGAIRTGRIRPRSQPASSHKTTIQRRDPEAGGAPRREAAEVRLSPKPRWPVGKRGSADRAGGRKGGDRGPRGAIAIGGDARAFVAPAGRWRWAATAAVGAPARPT